MGFKKPLDYYSLNHQIYTSGVELHSSRNDRFTQFEIKKDLYKLKWLIDEILESSDKFSGEEEFLTEQSQKKMWRKLKE